MAAGLLVSTFSTNKLTRFCLYTPLKVLITSIGIAAFLWIISSFLFESSITKYYFEVNGKDLFLYPFFVCFSCAMASYSIFLCKIYAVRNNRSMSFCSFFIIPLLVVSIFISTQDTSDGVLPQTIYYYIAFIIPQSYFYTSFLRKQNKGEWDQKQE